MARVAGKLIVLLFLLFLLSACAGSGPPQLAPVGDVIPAGVSLEGRWKLQDGARDAESRIRKAEYRSSGGQRGEDGPSVYVFLRTGDRLKITVMTKGFGAEMMSRMRMLPPAAGVEGVRRFVVETVERAGPNACPPVIVGVGLGSTFDGVTWLAKKALENQKNGAVISYSSSWKLAWRFLSAPLSRRDLFADKAN